MAAVTLESSNRVWQRVRIALSDANEAAQQEFKALKMYLATQKGNPQLQFLPINGNAMSSDGGAAASTVLATGASNLYGIYLRKRGAVATTFKLSANATTAGTDGTQALAATAVAVNEDVVQFFNSGKAIAAGLTVTQNTTPTGSTLPLNANRFDGFLIVGA